MKSFRTLPEGWWNGARVRLPSGESARLRSGQIVDGLVQVQVDGEPGERTVRFDDLAPWTETVFREGMRLLIAPGSYRAARGYNASLRFDRASLGTLKYVRPAPSYPGGRPSLVVETDSETLPNTHAPTFSIEVPCEAVTIITLDDHR